MIEDAFAEFLMYIERKNFEVDYNDIQNLYSFIGNDEFRNYITEGQHTLEKNIRRLWETDSMPTVLELAGICLYFCGKLYESMEG